MPHMCLRHSVRDDPVGISRRRIRLRKLDSWGSQAVKEVDALIIRLNYSSPLLLDTPRSSHDFWPTWGDAAALRTVNVYVIYKYN